MEAPSFEYWGTPGQYVQQNIYDYTSCDMSAVPSLSGSPTSTTFEPIPHSVSMPVYSQYPQYADETHQYSYGMTPSSSSDESPYCSPRQQATDIVGAYAPLPPQPPEKQHTTSGRRRAQNRAAQRAFRERKERHAKDLETQLNALTEKYRNLETSHTELSAAYDKLRKTIEVLTKDEGGASGSGDTLRKLLEILHGEVTNRVKREDDLGK